MVDPSLWTAPASDEAIETESCADFELRMKVKRAEEVAAAKLRARRITGATWREVVVW